MAEIEKAPTETIEKDKIEQTRQMCEHLVQVVNPGAKTRVKWVPKSGWFWNFETNEITMDEHDLRTKPSSYCLSVAFHEALHVWMSRVEHFTDDEWGQLGFGLGFNWVEDCGIENASDRAYIRGKDIIRTHLQTEIASGGGLDIEINTLINKSLGYVPQHMIIGAMMRNYFYQRQISGELNFGGYVDNPVGFGTVDKSTINPETLEKFLDRIAKIDPALRPPFEQIRPLLEDFWNQIPDFAASEPEVQSWAKQRADTYRKIWEIYKTLVGQSVQDHATKKFIDELVKGASFPGQQQGSGGVIIIDFDSLPPEIQQEIKEKMSMQNPTPGSTPEEADNQSSDSTEQQDKTSSEGQQGDQSGDQATSSGESPSQGGSSTQGGSPSGMPSSEAAPSQQASSSGQASGSGSGQTGSQAQQSEQDSSQDSPQNGVPWNELSKEAKEAAKEAFSKVEKETQTKMQEEAKSELEATEDSVNEKLEGHSNSKSVTRPTNLSKDQPKPGDSQPQSSDETPSEQQSDDDATGESASDASSPSKSASQSSSASAASASGESSSGESSEDTMSKSSDKPADTKPPVQERPPAPESEITAEQQTQIDKHFQTVQKQKTSPKKSAQESHFTVGTGAYQKVRNFPSVQTAISQVYEPLYQAFRPKSKFKNVYDNTGDDLDPERFLEWQNGQRPDADFMATESSPQQTKYRVLILIDQSGSMDDKEEEVFKMTVIFSDLFARLGIDFQINAFTSYSGNQVVRVYKKFADTEGFDDIIRPDVMARMEKMAMEGGGGTPTSQALTESYDQLVARNTEASNGKYRNIIITITDGIPGDSYGGLSAVASANNTVRYLSKKAVEDNLDLNMLGFGIGPGTEKINDIFPRLPLELRAEIATVLNQKYHTKQYTSENVGISFPEAETLTELLPTILSYVIDHPHEFKES